MESSTIIMYSLYALIAWFIYKRFAPVKGLTVLAESEFREQFRNNLNSILIDVREQSEFNRGHIFQAINIPLSQFKSRINEIPMDKDLFLYCQSGMRSKMAARILKKQGKQNMVHLKGGIMSWTAPIKK